jgi:hypothetical protein
MGLPQQHDRIDAFEEAYSILLEQSGSGVAAFNGCPARFAAAN